MSNRLHCCPVSPLTLSGKAGSSRDSDGAMDAEEELNPKDVTVDEPIVGEEFITLDQHGPGALEPKAHNNSLRAHSEAES